MMTELKRDCEVIAVPSGLRQTLPQGSTVRIVQTRGGAIRFRPMSTPSSGSTRKTPTR